MGANADAEATWVGAPARPQRLVLTWGAREKEVTASRPLLTVGRGDHSGLVIDIDKVSRLHALIKFTDHGFTLTDQSSNGTYVVDEAGTTHTVHNDTYLLTGRGSISFGVAPVKGQPPLVRYAVRSR
jgi:pSer/pThr/pTyr-binding forkhead associated (FHA) protein